ncbi:MAG: hypothetical protein V4543_09855 [Bacteroidota bacterium]
MLLTLTVNGDRQFVKLSSTAGAKFRSHNPETGYGFTLFDSFYTCFAGSDYSKNKN